MALDLVVPLAALLISVATLAYSRFDKHQSSRRDWVQDLQQRVADCEKHRDSLDKEVQRLRGVELDLLRRVFDLERKRERE